MLRWLIAVVALALVAVGTLVPAASAHHGDTGEYDITRPLFIRGEVLQASYGFPHATLRVRVSADTRVPSDLSRYEPLTQLSEAPSLDDLRVPEAGDVDVLLHPSITAETADPSSGRPEVGQTMEGIFVPRCPQGGRYDGEIRAVAFALGSSRVSLRSDPDPTGYSRGCDDDTAAVQDEPASDPGGSSTTSDTTANTEGNGGSVLWIGVVALAGLVAAAAAISALRGRGQV
jgi:hypothetical protein